MEIQGQAEGDAGQHPIRLAHQAVDLDLGWIFVQVVNSELERRDGRGHGPIRATQVDEARGSGPGAEGRLDGIHGAGEVQGDGEVDLGSRRWTERDKSVPGLHQPHFPHISARLPRRFLRVTRGTRARAR
jgi:hypothetical protein